MNREFTGKKLLILGGIKLACDIVDRAHALGAYVAVADYNTDSPAKLIADEAVLIDATDADALTDYCVKAGIDGVTTGFVDILMPVCYEVCRRLNLPYYATPKMLSMSTNKLDFKTTCEKYGLPVPKTYYVGSDIRSVNLEGLPYPVFVKPLDASGSRGCGMCLSGEEVIRQFSEAVVWSSSGSAVIEDYITGREFLLDYVAVDGEYRLLAMFDRYMSDDRGSARNYANISMAPSRSLYVYMNTMNDHVTGMFRDLGFTDGLIFLQGHTDGDRITFYEMGCRLGGSFYKLEQHCICLNPVDMTIRYALSGKMVQDIHAISPMVSNFTQYAFSYNALIYGGWWGGGGKIASVIGYDKIHSLPSYVDSIQHRNIGTSIQDDRTVDKPLITIYLANPDFEQAKADIRTLNQEIDAFDEEGKSILMHSYDPEKL